MRHAGIRTIRYHLPEGVLTNEQLASPEWPAEKILAKTGILERRVASAEQCASDLGVAAAQALFAEGLCEPSEIDFLLFCTQSPDYFLPTTACLVQERLGLRTDCGALDFNQGCSGFVYGLALAKSLIESLGLRTVLLITAETYSKFIHPRDRSARTIFGDGAAATLIGAAESDHPLLGPFVFGTDGRGALNLMVPAGGMRQPASEQTARVTNDSGGNERSLNNLYMNGPEIFNFTLKTVPVAVDALLSRAGLERDEVDYYVLHQANRFMLERLRDKMKIDPDRFSLELEDCGNTVSSTIPIALARAQNQGRIDEGSQVMCVGFGVGYSWAAGMVTLPAKGVFS